MRSRELVVGCVSYGPADDDDWRDDELIWAVAVVTDPMYGKPVPPPRHTAAEIVAMAQARVRDQPDDVTAAQREMARVARERREAALLAALLDHRLARRLRGRWWFTDAGRYRPDNCGERFA